MNRSKHSRMKPFVCYLKPAPPSLCIKLKLVLIIAIVHMNSSACFPASYPGRFDQAKSAIRTKVFNFNISYTDVTRLCHTKALIAVNGQFPGPVIYAEEGDHLIINVINSVEDAPLTIHWHGVRQWLSGWADGPAYITQCPIQPGQSYTYEFTVIDQRGTFFWHAHVHWLRATVYGALIILPARNGVDTIFPFPLPSAEASLLLGEWWNDDVLQIELQANLTGGLPTMPDAFLINGRPGPLYHHPCPDQDVFQMEVFPGTTYLLRLINAALHTNFFFGVANHSLAVVEADGSYVKPFSIDTVFLAPGQTLNVLLKTDQPSGWYYMVASIFKVSPANSMPPLSIPAAGILFYAKTSIQNTTPFMPNLPTANDSSFKARIDLLFTGLSTRGQEIVVPLDIDRYFFLAVSFGVLLNSSCSPYPHCLGPFNQRFSASINNLSFVLPNMSLLETAYAGGPVPTDFPDFPPSPYNFTAEPPNTIVFFQPMLATKVSIVEANENIEVILQDTSFGGFDNHPFHLHGYNFYVVGSGVGNFDPVSDPIAYNLLDPPLRHTVGVPAGGWVAIRFKADNPGVWFFHCHIEAHHSWGMRMAFWVRNGGANQTLPPPPADLPQC